MAPAPVDHDERRAALADAMVEIVARDGLEAASIRTVAAAAGVSIGAVQHYFSSKEDLLAYTFDHISRDQERRIEAIAHRATSARKAVRDILLELMPIDDRRAAELRVSIAYVAKAMNDARLSESLGRELEAFRRELADALRDAGVPDARREAASAIALVDGLATQLLFGGSDFTPAQAKAALDAHLRAVFGRAKRGKRGRS
jgi:AcrR family transcriptional regulator